jgi:hypothetical protein
MWAIVLILVIFLTIWMSLTFTDTLCDNKYVGMGLCYNAAWKTQRPVSFCPPCAQSPAPPAQQRVFSDNGTASCTRYCGGVSGAPWNNELPVAWGGATCVSAGKNNNLACSYVGADPATPGQLECLCQKSPSTPWSTGSFGSASGTGPGP